MRLRKTLMSTAIAVAMSGAAFAHDVSLQVLGSYKTGSRTRRPVRRRPCAATACM